MEGIMTDWIRCEDEQPGEVSVLAWGPEIGMWVATRLVFEHGPHWIGDDSGFEDDEVTHWMPLPEPPTEANDE